MKTIFRFAFIMGLAEIAHAQSIDQSAASGGGNAFMVEQHQALAQSFRPSVSGYLVGIDVELARNPNRSGAVGVVICRLQEGLTEFGPRPLSLGQTLFSTSIPLNSIPTDFAAVHVPIDPTALEANQAFGMVLTYPDLDGLGGIDPVAWRLSGGNYSGGAGFINNNTGNGWAMMTSVDLTFVTYMSPVPEPSSAAFGLAGLMSIFLLRRRKKTP